MEIINECLIKSWENAYSAVKSGETLWGKTSIPYISTIEKTFRSVNASIVLDFPCGDGRNTVKLANSFNIVIGADSSRTALKILAEEAIQRKIGNLVEVDTNLFSSCFIDNYFDGILCWDVLGHLQNPENAINELLRICKPGGVVIGSFFSDSEPCVSDTHMIKINESDYTYKKDYFYRLYTKEKIEKLMASFSGIDILGLEHIIWKEPPHEGFREYEHEHHSWAVIFGKEKGYI
jgi:ubiquinone/menaquinone biosynthesis C-methylase UbiE